MSDELVRAIEQAMPDFDGTPRMLTGYVLVAEFSSAEGNALTQLSSGMTEWHRIGMLTMALEMDSTEPEGES